MNLGALPDELIEAELFGTEAGAFTGATARTGRFEAADGGTLFLDEIGNLSRQRPGEAAARAADRRVRAARLQHDAPHQGARRSPRPTPTCAQAIREGRFREDLFYRLNVIELEVPPLARAARRHPAAGALFLRAGLRARRRRRERALARYPWPGNVRELQNAIRRACLLSHRPRHQRRAR